MVPQTPLDALTPGQEVDGFRAEAVYLDDADARMGARLTHLGTGFTFDVVFIESAPQAFVWVNSFPTSDMGEAHTQEHLLLGKGNKGRWVAGLESMSLADSSAFTMQWRTCYHFHTIAGVDVFWNVFEHKLDGLLHPDYSDEEIRREVRNFGVAQDAKTGALRLEEKGTVYNEMVRSFEGPNRLLWRTIGQLQYGPTHPLALSSGGFPEAIRKMTATDIRRFHDDNYHLANMGMIAAFPRTVTLDSILKETDGILTRQNGGAAGGTITTEADLPAPESAAPGKVELVHYAYSNAQEPGTVMLAWPPVLQLSVREELLLQLFLDNVAGDSTTELYKALVNSKSREVDVGATGVWSYMSSDQGDPIYMGVSGVRTAELTEKGVERIRRLILAQLAKIAAMPDGSPELAAFNERLRNRVTETRRGLAKFMNSPPGFGYRGTGSAWMNHLHDLARESGFEKSLTMKPEIAFVLGELGKNENVWRRYLSRWKLTETEPYAGASVADPTLLEREQSEREARIRAELDSTEDQVRHRGRRRHHRRLQERLRQGDGGARADGQVAHPAPLHRHPADDAGRRPGVEVRDRRRRAHGPVDLRQHDRRHRRRGVRPARRAREPADLSVGAVGADDPGRRDRRRRADEPRAGDRAAARPGAGGRGLHHQQHAHRPGRADRARLRQRRRRGQEGDHLGAPIPRRARLAAREPAAHPRRG